MAFTRYSREQLLQLRESPLVQRPDSLPSIEQWMEFANDAQSSGQQRRKTQSGRNDDGLSLQDASTQRPFLGTRHSTKTSIGLSTPERTEKQQFQRMFDAAATRRMGEFAAHDSTGDDVILGPPQMSFSSTSRNQLRNSDLTDKDRTEAGGLSDRPNMRDRFFKEREGEQRNRDKNGTAGQRRGWDEEGRPTTRARRNSQHEEDAPWGRSADRDRDRERQTKDRDGIDAPLRRNGVGRGKLEQSWRENTGESDPTRQTGRTGTWRDGPRDRERDWPRGNRMDGRGEEDPEWMTEGSKEESVKQARTQEDFQKWKESMKMSKVAPTPSEEKKESLLDVSAKTRQTTKAITPLDLDPGFGDMFGNWDKKADSAKTDTQKPPPGLPKPSKFAKLFAKDEPPQMMSPPPAPVESPPPAAMNASREDKEGFARILQLLDGSKSGKGADAAGKTTESRQDQERKQVLTPLGDQEGMDLLNGLLARQGISRETSSAPPARAPASNAAPVSRFFPGGSNTNTASDFPPVMENVIANAMARNGPPLGMMPPSNGPMPPTGQDRDNRAFLLNLMKQNTREPAGPEQRGPDRERDEQLGQHDEGRQRGMPPGMMELHRQRSEFGNEHKKAPPQSRSNLPPGFNMDDPSMLGLQRRNTTDIASRGQIPTNMGIPSQPMNPEWLKNALPGMPHHLPSMPEGRPNIGPPPGLRAPPGFPGPGPQPSGPPGSLSMGNSPLNHPAMNRGGPPLPGMFGGPPPPGGPNGQMPPPGPPPHGMPPPGPPPPGYFAPGPGQMPPPPHGQMPPPPGGPNGPPGFPPRGLDPREFMMLQQAAARAGGPGGPPPPPFHAGGFMLPHEERRGPPGFM